MTNTLKVLHHLTVVSEDLAGNSHYMSVTRGFLDCLSVLDMDNDTYTNFLKELNRKGVIEIDLNGWDDLNRAKVIVTPYGLQLLADHGEPPTIGFKA